MAETTPPMKLTLDHAPGFRVQLTGTPREVPLSVTVYLACQPTTEAVRQVEAHVQVWVSAAMYGAGAGVHVAPSFHPHPTEVARLLEVQAAYPTHRALTFRIEDLVVDPAYAVVLLQKLHCLSELFVPLERVHMTLPGIQAPLTFEVGPVSTVPSLYKPLPFRHQFHPEMGTENVVITAILQSPLNDVHLAVLREGGFTWCAQVMQGGYASKRFVPDHFFIQPDEDWDVTNDEIVWSLDKVFIDMRAFYGLLHLFAAFSRKLNVISAVEIA